MATAPGVAGRAARPGTVAVLAQPTGSAGPLPEATVPQARTLRILS
jgi:hypothetical protein